MGVQLADLIGTARPSDSGWYRRNCPWCLDRTGREDRKQSLGIRGDSGFYHCFRCGVAGRADGGGSIELPEVAPREDSCEATEPPTGFYVLGVEPGISATAFRDARDYLVKRGVPEDVWRACGIGACLSGKYAGRIIVPVTTFPYPAWIGFVARDWTGRAERKYLYPRGMQKGSVMFNDHALRWETDEPVFAVEGVFDAFSLWPNAVAFLGKPTEDQIEALAAAKRPIVPLLDGDAHREGWALAMRLRLEGQRAGSVRLPPCTDPDEVDETKLRDAALVAIDSPEGESIYPS